MNSSQIALISSDIDTLESIYKGHGCRRQGGYTYEEFEIGLNNFNTFLDEYNALATLFMVGQDLKSRKHRGIVKELHNSGHEIANHSYTHPHGFRWLKEEEQLEELINMEDACEAVIGRKPLGFRAPGWNISDDALPVLRERGYRYDSSIFPTSFMPILKMMNWLTNYSRPKRDRTTLGQANYAFAPTQPYEVSDTKLAKPGKSGLFELPITVSPLLRIPYSATFIISYGLGIFKMMTNSLKRLGSVIHLQFHLSDFVDYTSASLNTQTPRGGRGQYVPQSLKVPLLQKTTLFRKAMDILAVDYHFPTISNYIDTEMSG